MVGVRFDFEHNMVCALNACVWVPRYVLKVVSRLDYYAYDVRVFTKKIRELRKWLQEHDYEEWPEWIKMHVRRTWTRSFINHLLYVEELKELSALAIEW